MEADRPSQTAAFVAMGRALADARNLVPGFHDPFALALLPEAHRAAVEHRAHGAPARDLRVRLLGGIAEATSRLMAPRTMAIDEGLRTMPEGFQLVIVGAGLDARAYRMPELSRSIVLEVDHPASQGYKLGKVATMLPLARQLRHVAVDFARESLDAALERGGHDRTVPTAWVFEGVISYLTATEVERSIETMVARSAPGSRLLATYNEPAGWQRLLGGVTARVGEPQRATFAPEAMRRLLEARGMVVRSDVDGLARARTYGLGPGLMERTWIRFHHVVTADVV